MTAPALAAVRFAMALGVGAALGLLYGFLRPLGPRLNWLRDGIFVLCACFAWVYLGFGLCRGDLRFGYTAGVIFGGFAWEMTIGRLLRPIFSRFWKFFALLLLPFQKISAFLQLFLKKLFANFKKWVTMGWNICRNTGHRKPTGGAANGKAKIPHRFQENQPHCKGSHPGHRHRVHHRTGDTVRHHRAKPQPVRGHAPARRNAGGE